MPAALVAVAVDLAIGEPTPVSDASPVASSATPGAAPTAVGVSAATSDAAFVALGLDDAEDVESDDDVSGDLVDACDVWAT